MTNLSGQFSNLFYFLLLFFLTKVMFEGSHEGSNEDPNRRSNDMLSKWHVVKMSNPFGFTGKEFNCLHHIHNY